MKESEFIDVTNDMVEDIMKSLQSVVNTYAETYGMEDTMHCLGSALAIATGNMLSHLCFGLVDQKQRSPFMRQFFTLMSESADKHRQRHVAKQH